MDILEHIKEGNEYLLKIHEKQPGVCDLPVSEFDYDNLNSSFTPRDDGTDYFLHKFFYYLEDLLYSKENGKKYDINLICTKKSQSYFFKINSEDNKNRYAGVYGLYNDYSDGLLINLNTFKPYTLNDFLYVFIMVSDLSLKVRKEQDEAIIEKKGNK